MHAILILQELAHELLRPRLQPKPYWKQLGAFCIPWQGVKVGLLQAGMRQWSSACRSALALAPHPPTSRWQRHQQVAPFLQPALALTLPVLSGPGDNVASPKLTCRGPLGCEEARHWSPRLYDRLRGIEGNVSRLAATYLPIAM